VKMKENEDVYGQLSRDMCFKYKFLLEDCTLTYFELKCAKKLTVLSQKPSYFVEIRKPFQNTILQNFITQTWKLKFNHSF
jgi:hypothetical protein